MDMKKNKKWIVFTAILAVVVIAAALFLTKRGHTDIIIDSAIPRLTVRSPAFEDYGIIPDKHTGRGEDVSPALELSELIDGAASIAIIVDDLDVPWKANFTHWVIWNIPVITGIPESIHPGESVPGLDGAVQGVAFGNNRYRGPMPPFGTHRYQFHVFVLDDKLNLDASCGKSELIDAMSGRILQYGTLIGWYPRAG
jgi:Raf kinase inhibitor-like YbhB/YbcL family protein